MSLQDVQKTEGAAATTNMTTWLNSARLARQVSLVGHPFLIAPIGIVLILYLASGDVWAALGWAGLSAAFVVAPAILYLRRKLKVKHYTDADVSVREHRLGFYIFGTLCMVAMFLLLVWLDAPQPLIAMYIAGLAAVVISTLVTHFLVKASIHTGVIAGVAAATAFYSVPLAIILFGAMLVVARARLVLKRHNVIEAITGGSIAIICVVTVFTIVA